jgi:hypothetical protein
MPTFSMSVSNNMTAATSNTSIGSMQLNSTIPVPAMVTRSQTPYSGPDLMTVLPTEIFQGISSSLDADSIKALRLTNKAAAAKSQHNFVTTCRQSLTIDMTKAGIRRGLHVLQSEFVSASTKHVTFTTFSTRDEWLRNGSRPNARAKLPANGDVKGILDHTPNVASIVLRDPTFGSIVPQVICKALATSPRAKLTDLFIDGCTIDCKTLQNLLYAHRSTLRYLVLRNLSVTNGDLTYAMLSKLGTDFGLTRLVLDRLNDTAGGCFRIYHQSKLFRTFTRLRFENAVVHEFQCNDCHNLQRALLRGKSASMTGHVGVREGIAMIVRAKGQ